MRITVFIFLFYFLSSLFTYLLIAHNEQKTSPDKFHNHYRESRRECYSHPVFLVRRFCVGNTCLSDSPACSDFLGDNVIWFGSIPFSRVLLSQLSYFCPNRERSELFSIADVPYGKLCFAHYLYICLLDYLSRMNGWGLVFR